MSFIHEFSQISHKENTGVNQSQVKVDVNVNANINASVNIKVNCNINVDVNVTVNVNTKSQGTMQAAIYRVDKIPIEDQ